MDNESRRAREMVKNLPFEEKLKHYWGYYKKHVFIFLISALIVSWGVVQCVTAPEYDMNMAFYSVRFFEDERADRFAEYLEQYVDEINGNETVDVFIRKQNVDITKEIMQPEDHVVFSKIASELSADEYQTYILDEDFLEYFRRVYTEVIGDVMDLGEIPEIREMLGINEGEKLYLVTTAMFDRSLGNEEKVAEYNNALKIKKHFEGLLNK